MDVELTWKEMMLGAQTGVMRQVENTRGKYRQPSINVGHDRDWQIHIEGALAELAAAKALGIFPAGGEFRSADLGSGIEVRSSQREVTWMYMKESDVDDNIFVRVTGLNGDYKIHGWITGREGKEFPLEDKYNRGFQSRFVPYDALHPLPLPE